MNETQNMIAESAKRLFVSKIDRPLLQSAESGRWPEDLWQEVEISGFTTVLVPEARGGISGRWEDAYPLFRAVGYHCVPLPVAETAIASGLIARAGLDIPAGPLTVAQADNAGGLTVEEQDGALVINGKASSIPWASAASAIAIACEVDGKAVLGLVDNHAGGITLEPGTPISRDPRESVIFADCRIDRWAPLPGGSEAEPVLLAGALARSAMMVGAAEYLLDQSVTYANERVQFGRPIGKFQAIQHSLAILAGELTSAKTAVLAACKGESPSPFRIAVAKVRAGIAAGTCAAVAHQVHGAIGFTDEHSLHYATRRLWSWRAEFGADSVWAQRLGSAAIRRGGDNFWADLTAYMAS